MQNVTIRYWIIAILLLVLCSGSATAEIAIPEDRNKAVILAYHRIGEDHLPDQSITTEQFESHIKEIITGSYNVWPLGQIIDALIKNEDIPENTIALTFEGAHKSFLQKAFPLLQKSALPFTLFYSAEALDRKNPAYMSWGDLKTLSENKYADIQTSPYTKAHVAHMPQQDILRNINRARQRHRETFNHEATFLSYPFGEYTNEFKNLSEKQGYKAALGLHSGAAHKGTDLFTLPRFSMTEKYGDIERFRLVTKAFPLPVFDLEPADTVLTSKTFNTGFTLPDALLKGSDKLSCFLSGQDETKIERLGTRIEIRSSDIQNQNRLRLNCTMPGPISEDDEVQWRWFGLLYHRAEINPATNKQQQDEPLQPRE